MIKLKDTQAFTLVELIVVITILAILWTIAFISLQWYSANARDSVRIANLTNMDKWLGILQAKDWTLPEPEWNTTQITLSGSTIMTQWEMTQSMAEQHLKMSWDIVDPADSSNPIYSLSSDKKKYQVALFLEAENLAYSSRDRKYSVPTEILQNTHAADWKTFITKWNKLWIVLDDDETPVNQQTWAPASLELITTTTNHKIYLDDTEIVEWQWGELSTVNHRLSCKRILETGWARSANGWDWLYTINPSWNDIQVYCDMTTEGWGWTMIWRSGDTCTTNFWFFQESNSSPTDISKCYSIDINSKTADFDYIRFGGFDNTSNYKISRWRSYDASRSAILEAASNESTTAWTFWRITWSEIDCVTPRNWNRGAWNFKLNRTDWYPLSCSHGWCGPYTSDLVWSWIWWTQHYFESCGVTNYWDSKINRDYFSIWVK